MGLLKKTKKKLQKKTNIQEPSCSSSKKTKNKIQKQKQTHKALRCLLLKRNPKKAQNKFNKTVHQARPQKKTQKIQKQKKNHGTKLFVLKKKHKNSKNKNLIQKKTKITKKRRPILVAILSTPTAKDGLSPRKALFLCIR